jgi:hypothetical protein
LNAAEWFGRLYNGQDPDWLLNGAGRRQPASKRLDLNVE